jgi:dynein light intermediate chain 1
VILSLDEETKIAMEENMTAWKERRTGPDAPTAMPGGGNTSGTSSEAKQTPAIPLGPGEWEDGLGVPLSVVCMNANKIERMERDFGWQEEQFDFVLQWMRCVLLKRKSIRLMAFERNGANKCDTQMVPLSSTQQALTRTTCEP